MSARCVTFYSYKGGVGRTTAIANVAWQLAYGHSKRVLLIDWDLEAPGLHFRFAGGEAGAREQPGLLEYLEKGADEYARLEGDPSLEEVLDPALLPDYVMDIDLPGAPPGASLSLMAAGRQDAGYVGRLVPFGWRDFYERRGGYWIVERLRLQALASYDMVLIDAPSGRSPASSVTVLQLPDIVVMMFSMGAQSLHGIRSVGRSLAIRADRAPNERPPAKALLVPSNVSLGEPAVEAWLKGPVAAVYEELLADGVIEIRPSYSLGRLALGPERLSGPGPVMSRSELVQARAYLDLATLLADAPTSSLPTEGHILPHMAVVAADGVSIGIVEHIEGREGVNVGDSVSGDVHFIPIEWVDQVDTDVHLSVSSGDIKLGWGGG